MGHIRMSAVITRHLCGTILCSYRKVFLQPLWFCRTYIVDSEIIIIVNNHLDVQFFFMYVYFYSLHFSGSHVPIIRRINCINTSGVYHSV
jgi:hypothetical protein